MIARVGNSINPYQATDSKAKSQAKKSDTKDEGAVILEIGNQKDNSKTYQKASSATYSKEIDRLWQETKKTSDSLRHIVEKLIARQGKNASEVFSGKDILNVDAEARAEAEQLISTDGELGVKKTSKRIVDFAKSLAGSDKGKIPELRNAIKQGFDEAAKLLGGLPDISQKTYEEVMSKLDEWEKSE